MPERGERPRGRRGGCRRSAGGRPRAGAARSTGSTDCAGPRAARARSASANARPACPRTRHGVERVLLADDELLEQQRPLGRGRAQRAARRSSSPGLSTRKRVARPGAGRRLGHEREADRARGGQRLVGARAPGGGARRARRRRAARPSCAPCRGSCARPRRPSPRCRSASRTSASGTWSCSSAPISRARAVRCAAPSARTASRDLLPESRPSSIRQCARPSAGRSRVRAAARPDPGSRARPATPGKRVVASMNRSVVSAKNGATKTTGVGAPVTRASCDSIPPGRLSTDAASAKDLLRRLGGRAVRQDRRPGRRRRGACPRELHRLGHDVRLFLPFYAQIDRARASARACRTSCGT